MVAEADSESVELSWALQDPLPFLNLPLNLSHVMVRTESPYLQPKIIRVGDKRGRILHGGGSRRGAFKLLTVSTCLFGHLVMRFSASTSKFSLSDHIMPRTGVILNGCVHPRVLPQLRATFPKPFDIPRHDFLRAHLDLYRLSSVPTRRAFFFTQVTERYIERFGWDSAHEVDDQRSYFLILRGKICNWFRRAWRHGY
ncbi:hypothetical protein B0H19DRAFT_1376966 [Mycena capillaripes]|nr:hypothetical protein B0H19DRAFT_1376966 [Mycena capillaripes]